MKPYSGLSLLLLSLVACGQPGHRRIAADNAVLPGYDFSKPEIFRMPAVLDEISGISRDPASGTDTLYAIEDETGTLYRFLPGSPAVAQCRFGKKGDYEDVQVLGPDVIVLRSDGKIYRFPLAASRGTDAGRVDEVKNLVPSGEYEGLYADQAGGKIYVLCKHCAEKTSKVNSGYIFSLDKDGSWTAAGRFAIDVTAIVEKAGGKKIDFHPSALTRLAATKQWLVLSSVNKLLVVLDDAWTVQSVIALDPALFNQPEGITTDPAGAIFISNEKGAAPAATVLKFAHRP